MDFIAWTASNGKVRTDIPHITQDNPKDLAAYARALQAWSDPKARLKREIDSASTVLASLPAEIAELQARADALESEWKALDGNDGPTTNRRIAVRESWVRAARLLDERRLTEYEFAERIRRLRHELKNPATEPVPAAPIEPAKRVWEAK